MTNMKCGVKPVHPIPAHQLKTIPPKLPTPQLHRAGQKKTTRGVTFKADKRGRCSCQTFERLVDFLCVEIKWWTIQLLYGSKLTSIRYLDKIHGICNYILDCDLVCWSFLVHWSSLNDNFCPLVFLMGVFGRQHCCRCTWYLWCPLRHNS